MSFFDADGIEVDSPLTTNGNCSASMPPVQMVDFSRAVQRIEVVAIGANQVYLDSLRVNPR